MFGWILASKFLFPDKTAAATQSDARIASFTYGDKSPELPIQVIQP